MADRGRGSPERLRLRGLGADTYSSTVSEVSGLTLVSVGLPLAAAMLVMCWIGWRAQAGTAWLSILALVLLVWVWLRIDRRFEGEVLYVVTAGHGLVVADLFGLAVLAWVGVLCVRAVRARRGV
jgi:hypothetical protein